MNIPLPDWLRVIFSLVLFLVAFKIAIHGLDRER